MTDLHNLFSWARSSNKGLMLFIDEAEAFLGSRSRSAHTVHMRNALNALLYQTGDQSKHFMLVLATNRAADLDAAVLDRIDEAVHFELPKRKERLDIASQYFMEHVLERAPSRNDVWYRGGGFVASLRMGVDALLCGQGTTVFGSWLVPSKKIQLKKFEHVVRDYDGSSETEEMGEEEEEEEEEMMVEEEGVRSTKWRGRARTPVRKSSSSAQRKKSATSRKRGSRRSTTTNNNDDDDEAEDATGSGSFGSLKQMLEKIDCHSDTHIGVKEYMRRTAKITKNFSGRQLAKMMISCQGMIYGTEESTLRPQSYWTLVQRKVEEHKRKIEMATRNKASADDNEFNYA